MRAAGYPPSMEETAVPHVLVVDDDPLIVRLLELNFRLAGFDVSSASRGDRAVERAMEVDARRDRARRHDAGLDGYEVCRRLRERAPLRRRSGRLLDGSRPQEALETRDLEVGVVDLRHEAVRPRDAHRRRAGGHGPPGRTVIEERLVERSARPCGRRPRTSASTATCLPRSCSCRSSAITATSRPTSPFLSLTRAGRSASRGRADDRGCACPRRRSSRRSRSRVRAS